MDSSKPSEGSCEKEMAAQKTEKSAEDPASTITSSTTVDEASGSSGSQKTVMVLNDSKAGMEGLDLFKINQIIEETSRGSKFYEHKKRRRAELKRKVQDMQEQLAKIPPEAINKSLKEVDARVAEMEKRRELSRVIVHLDMDAFFASVEMRDNPELRDVPMAVGGQHMLSTSNYHARRFGVRAAMPGFIAKKLCPQLIIVPPHFEKYEAASKEVEEVLKDYDKENLSMSLDEAVMDITDVLAERNSTLPPHLELCPEDLVDEIREKIQQKTKLTVSAGIAANSFLAKICSDINKPNNQFCLESTTSTILSFLSEFPIRKVCGIGPVTEEFLKGLGVQTCGDLFEKRAIVNLLFKPATASFLISASMGIGSAFFTFAQEGAEDSGRKSFSCERTFGKGTRDEVRELTQDISEQIEEYLKKRGILGKTITLKIKTVTFETKTRCRSIADYTCNSKVIFENAWSIYQSYEKEIPDLKLRLIGIRISNLHDATEKDEDKSHKQKTILEMFEKSSLKEVRVYPCPVCIEEFNSPEALHRHVGECLDDVDEEGKLTKSQEPSSSKAAEDKEETSSIVCPVCNTRFRYLSSASQAAVDKCLNAHLDECLNMKTLNEIVKEEAKNSEDAQPSPATATATASSSSSPKVGPGGAYATILNKQSPSSSSSGSAKRKPETVIISKGAKNKKQKTTKTSMKCNAIESYFKKA